MTAQPAAPVLDDLGIDLPPLPEDIDLTDDDTALAHVLRHVRADTEPDGPPGSSVFANQI